MSARLSDRLSQMRMLREAREGRTGSSNERGNNERTPGGRKTAPEIRKEELFEGWSRPAPLVFTRESIYPFPLRERPYGGLLIAEEKLPAAVFYDFETTGLSGGAGTYIFLAGFAVLQEGEIHLRQFFLEDYPGEPDFITLIRESIASAEYFISYNGKRFDAPLLQTRARMSGVPAEMGTQLDLLFPCRRIWKRKIGSCSLSNVERMVLNRGREDDIPGSLIPDCYFSFLRGEEAGCMGRVIDHHRRDIISLVHLLFRIEEAAARPADLSSREEREGMANLLLYYGDERGLSILEDELEAGSMRAGRMAVPAYRRRGNFEKMEILLRRMWEKDRGLFQGIALAKLLEHRRKDLFGAVEIVDLLKQRHPFLSDPMKEELEHRRRRLQKKIALAGKL